MGVTTQELGKMLEQGQVLSTDFIPKFTKALKEFAAPGVVKATKSYNAELGRVNTAFTKFLAGVGEAGLLDIFASGLQFVRIALKGLEFALTPAIQAITFMLKPILAVSGAITNFMDDLDQGKEGLDGMKVGLQAITGLLGLAIVKWVAGTAVIKKLAAALGVAATGFKGLASLLARGLGLAAIIPLAMEFMEIITNTGRKTIFHSLQESMPGVGGAIGTVVDAISRVFVVIGTFTGTMAAAVVSGDNFKDSFISAINAVTEAWSKFSSGLGSTPEAIDFIGKSLDNLLILINKVVSAIPGLGGLSKLLGIEDKAKQRLAISESLKGAGPGFTADIAARFQGTDGLLNERGEARLIQSLIQTADASFKDVQLIGKRLARTLGVDRGEFGEILSAIKAAQKGGQGSDIALLRELKELGITDLGKRQDVLNQIQAFGNTQTLAPTGSNSKPTTVINNNTFNNNNTAQVEIKGDPSTEQVNRAVQGTTGGMLEAASKTNTAAITDIGAL